MIWIDCAPVFSGNTELGVSFAEGEADNTILVKPRLSRPPIKELQPLRRAGNGSLLPRLWPFMASLSVELFAGRLYGPPHGRRVGREMSSFVMRRPVLLGPDTEAELDARLMKKAII